jgi:uncharacterized protein (DUF427 family)
MMTKAIWNGVVLAESNQCEVVDRNYYFPPDSINEEYFVESSAHTVCFWKGRASYYDIKVNGDLNQEAAWYYSRPKAKAEHIKDYVAFWKGVEITK